MSHFSVLVIGKNVEKLLAPFHEFECTGIDDEYVQDIDKTEEARKEYSVTTERFYRDPDGNLYDPYADRFYREPTTEEKKKHHMMGSGCGGGLSWSSRDWKDGKGYRSKVHFIPDGWEEVKLPTQETFTEWAADYYGIKAIKQGEPIGNDHKYGRIVVDDADNVIQIIDRTNPNAQWDWYEIGGRWTGTFKLKDEARGTIGKPGLMTPKAEKGFADSALKKDIDFDGMASEGKAFSTFAVIKDGQWHERGSMGWWGCVSDEKDKDEWEKQFSELLNSIPDDTLLTVVDCHI